MTSAMWTKPSPLALILVMCSLSALVTDAAAAVPGDSRIENAKLVIATNQKAGTYTVRSKENPRVSFTAAHDLPTLFQEADRMALLKNRDLLNMTRYGHSAKPLDLMTYAPDDLRARG